MKSRGKLFDRSPLRSLHANPSSPLCKIPIGAMDALNGESSDSNGCVSCTTFNILAPIYKRLNTGIRESEFKESWLCRNEGILDRLLHLNSSLICLQEFWLCNEELLSIYDAQLGDAGYVTYKLARTNNRGDGLLTAVHLNHFRVLNYKELLFNDIGDRVAQLLHLELSSHFSQNQSSGIQKEVLVVNTHLIFPHDYRYCFLRLQQVYKILQYIHDYSKENKVLLAPVVLCGDWNGSKKGHVYKFLRSQGFVSCYDLAHQYTDNNDSLQKWISHRNHRGNTCGVDFIWLRNPKKEQKPLEKCYLEATWGNFMHLVENWSGGSNLRNIFNENSFISYPLFYKTLNEMGIHGHAYENGLCDEDIKNLWEYLDADKTGLIDVDNVSKSWNPDSLFDQHCSNDEEDGDDACVVQKLNENKPSATVGFTVKRAMLFPPEVEEGMWPDNYSLSDHAHLTVEFLTKMQPA